MMAPSRQPGIYVAVFVTLSAACVTLLSRLGARRITKVRLWLDDYMATVALVFSGAAWTGIVLQWVQKGLGLELADINLSQDDALSQARLLLYFAELSYAFSLAFSKLAILSFYWRMFKLSNIQIPIQVLVVASIIHLILLTFLAISHCVPVQGFWDKTIQATCVMDDSKFFFGTVLAHLLIDIAILILPVMQVLKLQLPTTQKIGIPAMFMFGILHVDTPFVWVEILADEYSVCIAAIIVLEESLRFDTLSLEIPWNIIPIMIWATVKINLAIVSAYLPMLRPIFKACCCGRMDTSPCSTNKEYPNSQRNMSIKMNTLHRSKQDETGSTYQLADSIEANSSIGEFETNPPDWPAVQTMITSRDSVSAHEQQLEVVSGTRGIMVKNEMSQKVSKAV